MKFLIVFFIFISSASYASNMQDVIDGNLKVEALKHRISAVDEKNKSVYGYWVPKVSFSHKNKDSVKDNLSENKLFVSSKLLGSDVLNAMSDAELLEQKSKIELLIEESKVASDALVNVMTVFIYKGVLSDLMGMMRTVEDNLAKLKQDEMAGVASKGDIEQAQLLLAKIKSESDSFLNIIAQGELALERISRVKYSWGGESSVLNKINTYSFRDELNDRENLNVEIARIAAALLKGKAESSMLNWQAGVNIESRDRNGKTEGYAEFVIDIDLFDYSRVNELRYNARMYESEKLNAEWVLNNERKKYADLVNSISFTKGEIERLLNQQEIAENISIALMDEFSLGKIGYYQIISNERERLSILTSLANARASLASDVISLMAVTNEIKTLYI